MHGNRRRRGRECLNWVLVLAASSEYTGTARRRATSPTTTIHAPNSAADLSVRSPIQGGRRHDVVAGPRDERGDGEELRGLA